MDELSGTVPAIPSSVSELPPVGDDTVMVAKTEHILPAVQEKDMKEPKSTDVRKAPVSKSLRAGGLVFPVGRVHRLLKKNHHGPISETSSVYLTGVMEYLAQEVLDMAGAEARKLKRKRITSRALYLGFHGDEDLRELYETLNIVLPGSGVVPDPGFVHKSKKPKQSE